MLKAIYRSIMATVLLAIILCGAYPLLVTGIGRALFPAQVDGSIVSQSGKPVGSKWIGQAFSKPEYFHGRPSSAGSGYDASNSSGSNLGPTNQKFYDGLKANIEAVLKDNPTLKKGEVPVDLVTASASGLDPHISIQGAEAQIDRVAKARHLSSEQVKKLVVMNTTEPKWGVFGEAQVNVLELNLALDSNR